MAKAKRKRVYPCVLCGEPAEIVRIVGNICKKCDERGLFTPSSPRAEGAAGAQARASDAAAAAGDPTVATPNPTPSSSASLSDPGPLSSIAQDLENAQSEAKGAVDLRIMGKMVAAAYGLALNLPGATIMAAELAHAMVERELREMSPEAFRKAQRKPPHTKGAGSARRKRLAKNKSRAKVAATRAK